jgi:flagellum-specific peptidoglycan hydrolase FlgJ
MGKTKSYVDPETINQHQGYFSNQTAPKTKTKNQYMPGRNAIPPVEEQSIEMLLKQIFLRFRRTWISLRFQFHSKTLGVFRHNLAMKLGFLLLAGYFLLSTERNVANLFSNPSAFLFGEKNARYASVGEARMDVGSSGFGKSVSWEKNQAAPIGVSGLSEEQALDYIERYRKIAQAEMEKFGIPASISLAQGLVESRGGLSTLARRNNNHFGMKCFSKRCAKGHCSNFTDDHHKDFFRIYKNSWESWRAHSEMLASGRYTSLQKYGKDYQKWAYGLKNLGYATDKTYAEKLIGMVERYDLQKFDR